MPRSKKDRPRAHVRLRAQGGRPTAQGGRQAKSPRDRILRLLKSRPLDKVEISKALNLAPDERGRLRELLQEMETAGDIARIRKDRYIIPQVADLFTGVIQFHATGAAHVLNETAGQADLYISGENTGTAMHGDRVVARVGEERGRPGAVRREGQVIRILQRASETIVGTLQKTRNFYFVVADDPRFVHHLYVPTPKPPLRAQEGDKVVAKIDTWPSRHVNPEGHLVEVLGRAGAPGVDMLSIIKKNRLPLEFPSDVIQEAGKVGSRVQEDKAGPREDLRSEFIFTIDPDDARDFDDAINVETTPRGWRLGVHIADVSHYVRPKSALDREAYLRGNSVYLADRVIPMLPETLSNGICSLRPEEDRLTFSVFAEIGRNGKILSARFAKTIIRSAVRLTYKEAFARLQKLPKSDLDHHLHTAWSLASLLRRQRFTAGSLDLDFPEVKVWLDPDGKPIRLEKVENDISHQLIEEFMLLANELVGRELKRTRQPAIYRVHEKPDPEKLVEYREVAQTFGVKCGDLTNRPELQKLLAGVRGKPFEYAVKLGLLKSLKRAHYSPDPLGHYGLHKSDYAHFTSPIRRYADLVVHRALESRLGLTRGGPASTALGAIAEHISGTERVAADAEKDSVRLKKLEYFQNQIAHRTGEVFQARILDVRNYGLLVELPDSLMTGLVHVSALDGDFYQLDPARGRLVGKRTRQAFRVGDQIPVLVARVDLFKQQIDFRPA